MMSDSRTPRIEAFVRYLSQGSMASLYAECDIDDVAELNSGG
jgi:hypothetical protein